MRMRYNKTWIIDNPCPDKYITKDNGQTFQINPAWYDQMENFRARRKSK